jgi:uncharacterized protein with NRDE domain
MCLIVFANDCHPVYRLILGANRDEYRARPSEAARFWNGAGHILAGRDSQAGGTWLGVTTYGTFAAVTNYRDVRKQVVSPPSRGQLVADFLRDPSVTPEEYGGRLQRDGERYDGFNLLYGTVSELHYFTNRGGSSGRIQPGIHGLSNHLLDSHWPKVSVAKSRLERIIREHTIDPEQLFEALSDPLPYADEQLPDTGFGLEQERMLSPIFITNELYGTRSTTIVLIDRDDVVTFIERVFDLASGFSTQSYHFTIRSAVP